MKRQLSTHPWNGFHCLKLPPRPNGKIKSNQIKSFRIQAFLGSPQELTVQSENEDLKLQGGRAGWRLCLITRGRWLNESQLLNKTSIKNKKVLFWEFLVHKSKGEMTERHTEGQRNASVLLTTLVFAFLPSRRCRVTPWRTKWSACQSSEPRSMVEAKRQAWGIPGCNHKPQLVIGVWSLVGFPSLVYGFMLPLGSNIQNSVKCRMC